MRSGVPAVGCMPLLAGGGIIHLAAYPISPGLTD
jgi:hypothetical protein